MRVVRADWVCPVARPPIANGWVAIDGARVHALGGPEDPPPAGAPVERRAGEAVLPGLVNAHTHLELSWLAGKVPPAHRFTDWVAHLVLTRGGTPEAGGGERTLAPMRAAVRELRAAGTVAVGDISNTLASPGPLADAGLDGVVFHELLGFSATGAVVEETRGLRAKARVAGDGRVRISLAPHAPYSTSAELFRAVRAEVDAGDVPLTSVHLAESPEEIELLERGTGAWPRLLARLGAWRDDWRPPGVGPVEYLERLGVLDAGTLAVHGVQLSEASLATLARLGCTLVTCPRSNQWVGVGAPPVSRFYASGVRVAVGTDSLASAPDLNLFAELKELRWLAPDVPAAALVASATLEGARALGLDGELGSIEPGKRAALIAVRLPGPVADVEEALVSGIEPRQVTWL
ncbi:MAG: amidohydrolase family protein [Acidobacteriota bacterium]